MKRSTRLKRHDLFQAHLPIPQIIHIADFGVIATNLPLCFKNSQEPSDLDSAHRRCGVFGPVHWANVFREGTHTLARRMSSCWSSRDDVTDINVLVQILFEDAEDLPLHV
jgi:hypothetical protein